MSTTCMLENTVFCSCQRESFISYLTMPMSSLWLNNHNLWLWPIYAVKFLHLYILHSLILLSLLVCFSQKYIADNNYVYPHVGTMFSKVSSSVWHSCWLKGSPCQGLWEWTKWGRLFAKLEFFSTRSQYCNKSSIFQLCCVISLGENKCITVR